MTRKGIKIVSMVFICVCGILSISACNRLYIKPNVIAKVVQNYLGLHGIYDCTITLPKRYDIKYLVDDIKVTDAEIKEAVCDEIESYNKLIEYKADRVVEMGDFVEISYRVECDGKCVNYAESEILKVGQDISKNS